MKKFEIVEASINSMEYFENKIQDLLNEGWEFHGEMILHEYHSEQTCFIQAMIFNDDKNKDEWL